MKQNLLPAPYLKWGNGKTVIVLLHYFGGNANCWKWVAELFPKSYTCIAINLPGFGGTACLKKPCVSTYAIHIQSLLKKLKVEKYFLVGHSMGGKIAMQIGANDRLHQIQHLILIAPSPPGKEPITDTDKEMLLSVPTKPEAINNITKLLCQPITSAQLEVAVTAAIETRSATRNWWVNEGSQQSITAAVSAMQCAVTILASLKDPAIKYTTIKKEVIPFFKKAKLISVPDIGHLYPLEAAGWLQNELYKITKMK